MQLNQSEISIKEHLRSIWQNAWELPAQLNPWEWAEENIRFNSIVSPMPGRYNTAATPYVREVLEAFADPRIRQITLCWSAQSSKTTTTLVGILYLIANDPGNCLFVRPSLDAAMSLSENKLMPLIEGNKIIARFKSDNRDDFKKAMLKLSNMVIFIKGANPNQLSAESCKVVILDETDKYDTYSEKKAEADLVSLAFERTKFYRNHKKVATSTPTVPAGTIWQLFKEGDQRLFMVPCPLCAVEFKIEQSLLRFNSSDDLQIVRKTAHLECPNCHQPIFEKHKFKMLAAGRWVPQNPNANGEHRSYHLSEFYSPVTKWGELAEKFVKASHKSKIGDFGPLHNYINSSLAEPWDPTQNNSRKPEELARLCDNRPAGVVPDQAIGLTIGIDTQDLYFWFTIRAWGREHLESWQVLSGRLETFEDIERLIYQPFKSAGGKIFNISAGLFDSGGHRTAEVYEFCRKHRIIRASKGSQKLKRPWEISKIEQLPNGKPLPGGIRLVHVHTIYFKDLIAGKMTVPIDEPGAFRFHSDPGEDYFNHLVAEYRNDRGIWICPEHRRNDLWDCEVLAICCADLIGLRFLAVRNNEQAAKPEPAKEPTPDNPYLHGSMKRQQTGTNPFLHGSMQRKALIRR